MHILVSKRTLEERIRTRLARDGNSVIKNTRPDPECPGRYCLIDGQTNAVYDSFDDLEAYGRVMGLLGDWEVLAT
jgi:hypothetical protein